MRLEMLTPPDLVTVRDATGELLPALLLARRGERSYVQVSRGAGCNSLAWVAAAAVSAGSVASVASGAPRTGVAVAAGAAPSRGLPRGRR